MTALSLHLPEKLAHASQKAAAELGISRTEFIRQAIEHELMALATERQQKDMAKSFAAMQKRVDYLNEAKEIDDEFSANLPKDRKEWWKK